MTSFVEFCRAHGALINELPPVGVWKRCGSADKPHSRNVSIKYMGDHGFIQDHATMMAVAHWQEEGRNEVDQEQIEAMKAAQRHAAEQIAKGQVAASDRARDMLAEAEFQRHAYLQKKGFHDMEWSVLDGELLVPMYIGRQVVGVQRIKGNGEKRFLAGQRCSGAEFVINRGDGMHVFCEGLATGLSIKEAMTSLRVGYRLHICFSASNVQQVAKSVGRGLVVADNDASGTGQRVAEATGLPYWMSDTVGEDFNDFHRRVGLFRASMSLKKAIP